MSEKESRDNFESGKTPDEISTREDDEVSETSQSCHTGDSSEDPEQATKVSETAKAESPPKNLSPSSAVSTSPIEFAETRRKHSSSSDSAVMELNRAARSLDHCVLDSGKLVVFQKYFHQPKMKFFVKPEGRRRHNAGNQSQHRDSHDPIEVQHPPEGQREDPLGYVRSYNPPPGPTLNQAGAIIGYPERSTTQELSDNENEMVREHPFDPEHSLGSAETVAIHEAYAGNFSPINRCDGSDAMSSAGISNIKVSSDEGSVPSDTLPAAVRVSPLLSDSDARRTEREPQQKFGFSKPVDIPGRSSGSLGSSSGSYPDNFHKSVSQQSSLEFEASVSTYINPRMLLKRKLSKDSSAEGSHRSLSRESSVDLSMYMTAKPVTTGDDGTSAKLNEGSPTDESPHPFLIPDHIAVDPSGSAQDLSLGFSEMTLADPPPVHEISASASTNRAENVDLHSSETSANRNAEDSEPTD